MRAFTEGLPEGHIAADISDAAAASDAAHRFATVSPAAPQQSRQGPGKADISQAIAGQSRFMSTRPITRGRRRFVPADTQKAKESPERAAAFKF